MGEAAIQLVVLVGSIEVRQGTKLMQYVSISIPKVDFEVPFKLVARAVTEDVPFCSEFIHVGCGGDTFLAPRLFLLLCNIVT